MDTGLTIAFICNGNTHPTIINYNKFGNHYWDDSQNNNSKIGYYFAYYFQQKYVYIHKIINILQPHERPSSMIWDSNRQILCLSKQLKQFTWAEWITCIGFGAPYTPKYRMTQTGSWSQHDLQNHSKYKTFNFVNFKNSIEDNQTPICLPDIVEEDEEVIFERERKRKADIRMAEFTRMQNEEDELDRQRLQEIRNKKIFANIIQLQNEGCNRLLIQRNNLQKEIDRLSEEQLKIDAEIEEVKRNTENITLSIKL